MFFFFNHTSAVKFEWVQVVLKWISGVAVVTDAARPFNSAVPLPHLSVLTSTSTKCLPQLCKPKTLWRRRRQRSVLGRLLSWFLSFQGSGVVCADGSCLGWNHHTHSHSGPMRDSLLASSFFFLCQTTLQVLSPLWPAVNDDDFTRGISRIS